MGYQQYETLEDIDSDYEDRLICPNPKCGNELTLTARSLYSGTANLDCPYCEATLNIEIVIQFRIRDAEVLVEEDEEDEDD